MLLLFLGVALVAPRLVRPLAAALGWPGARFGGAAGNLARDNATRNPGRTASTAAALMIGLALITFVSVLGQGLRSSFSDAVDELFIGDYALLSGDDQLPAGAVQAARRAPGVEAVSAILGGDGRAFDAEVHVNGVDANLTEVVDMTWVQGSDRTPAQLGSDGALVKEEYADDHDLAVGSRVRLETPRGAATYRVLGVFEEPQGGSPFGELAVSNAALARAFPEPDNDFTLVNVTGARATRTPRGWRRRSRRSRARRCRRATSSRTARSPS